MRRRAFTLVELLVVIAIIGLLSTVAIVGLDSARIKARNAKRVADIKQLLSAFSMGASSNGSLPSSLGVGDGWVCVSASCGGIWSVYPTNNATVNSFLAPYLPNKPSDPPEGRRQFNGYLYNSNAQGGPYDNSTYFTYGLEQPATCTLGRFYNQTANYVQCYVKVE
jgi:prepilin-type N-terminal cleavage/methylation domain-containing protein